MAPHLATANLRNQRFLDNHVGEQLIYALNERSVGCTGLTEVQSDEVGSPDSEPILDATGDRWWFISHEGTRVGFLVSYKFDVVHSDSVGPRVMWIELQVTKMTPGER